MWVGGLGSLRYHGDGSGNVVVDIGYYPGETRFDSRGDDANLLMDDEKGSWRRGGVADGCGQ